MKEHTLDDGFGRSSAASSSALQRDDALDGLRRTTAADTPTQSRSRGTRTGVGSEPLSVGST